MSLEIMTAPKSLQMVRGITMKTNKTMKTTALNLSRHFNSKGCICT